ncbi:MAG: formate--tetrahydrofolate ligase [Gemmatimonadota bacterium]
MLTDIEIAQRATPRPIAEIAERLGLAETDIQPYGRHKAKVPLEAVEARGSAPGKLVLVTGMNPTRVGEGKSTVAVGLTDALALRDRSPVLCLREPSLGPVFGIKGGAAGGGYAQVVPMEEINLHFTGDLHALTAAHNLLSSLIDNRLHFGLPPEMDARRVIWPRAVDLNDRALRRVLVGLGGPTGGIPREERFVITAASEVMAIFCLARDLEDLSRRLRRIVVGYDRGGEPVRAADLEAAGAMTLLLRDALAPNLVQTLAGVPAFVHGGPFANIAHGCNSLVATRAALALGDVVVTEAGFGAELGAEKFFDIKCRAGGLEPAAAVLVATVRALKHHGGAAPDALTREDVTAVGHGLENLVAQVENVRRFGVPPLVALNRFASDTEAELQAVVDGCREIGAEAVVADPHASGGEGALGLADALLGILEADDAEFRPLYDGSSSLAEKIETVATRIYGAAGVDFLPQAVRAFPLMEELGLGNAPVCIAKTQYSLSDDPTLLGRPREFHLTVRELTPSAGAGFVVAKTGDIMTMPGLSRRPSAEAMGVDEEGKAYGLF